MMASAYPLANASAPFSPRFEMLSHYLAHFLQQTIVLY